MTKQQENSAFGKMLKEFPKTFGRVNFRERLMLRTAFTYVVEEVIADIKANCDLAIEGRDIKIKELELELTVEKDQHQEEINLHLHAEEYIKSLEQQIEKIKTIIKKKYCKKCPYRKDNEMFLKIAYDENKKLKEQIEKMKCCGNCTHRRYWGNELGCKLDLDKQFECDNNNKKYWEFREE